MSKRAQKAASITAKRRFAALYVNGPEHLRGNWQACEAAVGATLDAHDSELQTFIQHEGGNGPVVDAPVVEAAPVLDVTMPAPTAPVDEWQKRAEKILPQLVDIAAGKVKATAAQVSAAKEIVNRAFGRVAERDSDKRPAAGLLVLPALGENNKLTVCPRCSLELTGVDPCSTAKH